MADYKILDISAVEKALMTNDLSSMTIEERGKFYNAICDSLGLNPLTQPFAYIEMPMEGGGKKLVLYALKSCTEQLRKIYNISIKLTAKEITADNILVIQAQAIEPNGRTDESTAAVWLSKYETQWDNYAKRNKRTGAIIPLQGEALANAYMKCETKAKRRVTLSICGLAFLDELEVESMKILREEEEITGAMIGQVDKVVNTRKKIEVTVADDLGPVFYDLSKLDEPKRTAAFEYLEKNNATLDPDNGLWRSDKPLKKLISCQVKLV